MIPLRRAYAYYQREGISPLFNTGVRIYLVPKLSKLGKVGTIAFLIIHFLIPFIGKIYMTKRNGMWVVKRVFHSQSYAFPSFPSPAQLHNVVRGYSAAMVKKYTSAEYADVDPNDTVVDVGAFVGAFSIGVAGMADSVYAVEPSQETVRCLERNTQSHQNIESVRALAWNEDRDVSLKLGIDPTDHSALNVDGKDSGAEEVVPAYRMETLMTKLDIQEIDFLKVDAEGAEPEVLEGCSSTSIRKIAVDCGAERYGQSTAEEVKEKLQEEGFQTEQTYQVVLGWRSP